MHPRRRKSACRIPRPRSIRRRRASSSVAFSSCRTLTSVASDSVGHGEEGIEGGLDVVGRVEEVEHEEIFGAFPELRRRAVQARQRLHGQNRLQLLVDIHGAELRLVETGQVFVRDDQQPDISSLSNSSCRVLSSGKPFISASVYLIPSTSFSPEKAIKALNGFPRFASSACTAL